MAQILQNIILQCISCCTHGSIYRNELNYEEKTSHDHNDKSFIHTDLTLISVSVNNKFHLLNIRQ